MLTKHDPIIIGIIAVIIIGIVVLSLTFVVFPGIACQEEGGVWVQNAFGWYSCAKGN